MRLHLCVFVSLLCSLSCFGDEKLRTIELEQNEATRVELLPRSLTLFQLDKISSSFSYVVFQVHSQYKNVTVSSDRQFDLDSATSPGSDRGIVTMLQQYQTRASWYVNSSNDRNLTIIAMATMYTALDPVPGACNQEFNMETNANVHLSYDVHSTLLQFQFSNLGYGRGNQPYDCEAELSWKNLTYDLYLFYLQENNLSENMFFGGVQKMMTVDLVTEFGTQITHPFQRSKHHSNFTIASYLGRGAVYAVVVTYTGERYSRRSMYVPAVTYACEFEGKVDTCEAKHNVAVWVLCSFTGIVGLFMCFVGHQFFKTEMFLCGFLSFLLVFFIVLTLFSSFSFTLRVILACVFGIVGGCLWLALWWFLGIPVVCVLLAGLNLGYLFSSIIFYTPFGNMDVWKSDFNYGMTFTCGVLLIPVLFLYFTKLLSILFCTFLGSFGFVAAINAYIHGSLSYVLVNSIRRAVSEEFNTSIMIAPFQLSEIILSCVWGVLAISGTAIQLYRGRNKPDFPECPYKTSAKNERSFLRERARLSPVDERAPLLVNPDDVIGRRSVYGTDQSVQSAEIM